MKHVAMAAVRCYTLLVARCAWRSDDDQMLLAEAFPSCLAGQHGPLTFVAKSVVDGKWSAAVSSSNSSLRRPFVNRHAQNGGGGVHPMRIGRDQ